MSYNMRTGERGPFKIIEGRRYRHVGEDIGGQYTARWSYDKQADVWYVSDGWKRAGSTRLNAEQRAYVEDLLGLIIAL